MKVKAINNYRMAIRANIRAYWNLTWDFMEFYRNMERDIRQGLRQAWADGMKICGMTLNDMTDDEKNKLESEINNDLGYLQGFADAVSAGAKPEGGKLTPLMKRGEMWINRYNAVMTMAQVSACGDVKMIWLIGETEKHCSDCSLLNGRIYRASVWEKYGVLPQSNDLECRGYNCLCKLIPTNDPAWGGHPPRLHGG